MALPDTVCDFDIGASRFCLVFCDGYSIASTGPGCGSSLSTWAKKLLLLHMLPEFFPRPLSTPLAEVPSSDILLRVRGVFTALPRAGLCEARLSRLPGDWRGGVLGASYTSPHSRIGGVLLSGPCFAEASSGSAETSNSVVCCWSADSAGASSCSTLRLNQPGVLCYKQRKVTQGSLGRLEPEA